MSRQLSWLCLMLVAALAWIAPALLPDPAAQDLSASLQAPSAGTWLGTDALGRNVAARLAAAARISLSLALLSALLAATLGAGLGLLAAWRRGWTERLLLALADAVLALPGLLWVLLLSALAPGRTWPLYLGLVLTAWVEFFRTTRASAATLLAGPQVQSSQLLGFGRIYIVQQHVWPALRGTLLALTALAVCNAVLAVSALGFVGIGLRPPAAELGLLMTEALPYYADAPWMLAPPVLLLLATVLALQTLGEKHGLGT